MYSDCGDTCDTFFKSKASGASHCKPGCYCPGDKLLIENGTCVEKTECGCRSKHSDKLYQKGEVSPIDCSK